MKRSATYIFIIMTILYMVTSRVCAQTPDDKKDIEIEDDFFKAVNEVFFSFVRFDSYGSRYWLDKVEQLTSTEMHRVILECLRADCNMLVYGNVEGALNAVNEAVDYFKNGDSRLYKYLYAIALNSKGYYMMLEVGNNEAEALFRKAAQEADRVGAVRFRRFARMLQVETLIRKRNYVDALYYARKVGNTSKNDILEFQANIMLFKAYSQLKAFDLAELYRKKLENSEILYQSLAINVEYQLRYAESLLLLEDLHRARVISDNLAIDATHLEQPIFIWAVNVQRARILAIQNECEEAEKCLQTCRANSKYLGYYAHDANFAYANIQLTEAIISLKRKQYTKAKQLLDGLALTKELRISSYFMKQYYKAYEDLYCGLGDYKMANKTLERYMYLSDSISKNHIYQREQDMIVSYQNDTTILKHRAYIYQQTENVIDMYKQTMFTIVISVSICLLLVLLVILQKRRIYLKQELEEQNAHDYLESEVNRQTAETRENNRLIGLRNADIEKSSRYAQLIQQSVLPSEEQLRLLFTNGAFVLNISDDVVRGSFCWYKKVDKKIYFFGCSGSESGVPGAMISMVVLTFINDEVRLHYDYSASQYWNAIRSHTAYLSDSNYNSRIDISVAIFDTEKRTLNIASAKPNVIYMHNGEHKYVYTKEHEGVDTYIEATSGDVLYLFTSSCNRIFRTEDVEDEENKLFVELLASVEKSAVEQRKELLRKAILEWNSDKHNGLQILSVTI